MSLVKSLKEATNKTSLADIVKKAGLSIILDGNWGQTAMQMSGGTQTRLVGEDPQGNKYYEDLTRPFGRHRWVVYADNNDYNASSIHPHWHAWMHCISDDNPVAKPPIKRKFDIEYAPNATGTPGRYLPKGSWENPAQRNWGKVEYWTPPHQTGQA